MNNCVFIGNLTRDPEMKYTIGGKVVCNFGLALNYKVGDKESVTFLEMVAWEKQAELIGEWLKKGSKAAFVTRARQESWEDKETGAKRSKLVFDVQNVEFVGTKADSAAAGDSDGASNDTRSTTKSKRASAPPQDDTGDDVVPF